MSKHPSVTILILLFLLPNIVLAHTGVGETAGFIHGLSHPIGGIDHLLAMLAVGIWAAQIGGRALWLIPGTFIMLMILGGAIAFAEIPIPFIEKGILASVLVLGILVAVAFKCAIICSLFIVGFFALFHGYAHAAEIPAVNAVTSYSIGFSLATGMLHTIGIASGAFIKKINLEKFNRFTGGAIALAVIYLLTVS